MARTWKYKILFSNQSKPEDLESKLEAASKEGWEPILYQTTAVDATRSIAQYLILRSPAAGSAD